MENEEEIQNELKDQIEKLFQRIIISKKLTISELAILCQFGATAGLVYLNDILTTIEQKGEKAAGKKLTRKTVDLLLHSMKTEFHYRTSMIYATGNGLTIPEELYFAFMKLENIIYDLESDMLYGSQELVNSISQRELAYLFSALANKRIFHSSADVLASSIESITNYSEDSIRRVIIDLKKTNGGWSEEDKEKLLKKISDAINSF